jgi:rhodanese-related sulfurtransferase
MLTKAVTVPGTRTYQGMERTTTDGPSEVTRGALGLHGRPGPENVSFDLRRENMRTKLWTLMLVAAFAAACEGETGDGSTDTNYMDITPAEAKQLIEDDADLIIIDVSGAWADGHLPGAVNYPLGDGEGGLNEAIPMLDAMGTYLVYCHGDGPSMAGAQALVDAGFEHVYRLAGNYGAWVDAGYDIEM